MTYQHDPELERYAWRQANLMITEPHSDRDDAVQEAMIEVWKTQRVGERSTPYLHGVIFKTISTFASSRRHTGSERPVGSKSVDVLRKRTWFDPRSAGVEPYKIDAMFGSNTPHLSDPREREQVHTALRTLNTKHRELIFRKFWEDQRLSGNEDAMWRITVRPKLRALLSA